VQSGPPEDVYRAPRTRAVARFLGYNVTRGGSGYLAVHPADVRLDSAAGRLGGLVVASGSVGRGWVAYLDTVGGERWEVRGAAEQPRPAAGASVRLGWEREVALQE